MSFISKILSLSAAAVLSLPTLARAQEWLTMSDRDFAMAYVDQAFGGSPEERYEVAWMLFARVNQQIESGGHTLSTWETWPSDPDTFQVTPKFVLGQVKRETPAFVTSKAIRSGMVDTKDVGVGKEEVTRNMLGYDYIVGHGLNAAAGVTAYLSAGNMVQMPIGSVEIKARWEAANTPETEGAYLFYSGQYALTGLHIMVKMQQTPEAVYTSDDPSWFWTTFEFDKNPGLAHARTLIDQSHDSATAARAAILQQAGLGGSPFEMYSPNGTQITFEEDGAFKVLGHTMMEDFAGVPQGPVVDWTSWNSSCHACHATASWDIKTSKGNDMPEPVGKLTTQDLENLEGYMPLDFMWPIAFNAK